MAVRENCTEVVQLLLENKADVNHMNPHGGTPLFEAVDKGYFHVSVTLNHLKKKTLSLRELLAARKSIFTGWILGSFYMFAGIFGRALNFLRRNYTCTT